MIARAGLTPSTPYLEMMRRAVQGSHLGQGIPQSAIGPSFGQQQPQQDSTSGIDQTALKNTIQALQGLGVINGNVDAEFLAQMVMLLANKRKNDQTAQKQGGQGFGGMPNMGSSPQMRGGLPAQQFANSKRSPQRSWRPPQRQSRSSPYANNGAQVQAVTNPLTGNDKKTAEFINQHLASRGSPAANAKSPTAGEMMVQAGKQHNVDPMVLLSISQHETNHGKIGVGVRKMLGVSAYDANPNNVNPKFDGLRNQIFKGARTFAKLRAKGGASASDPIGKQLKAANVGGWATDRNWHSGVGRHFNDIARKAHKFNGSTPQLANQGSVKATPQAIAKIPNYHQLAPQLQRAALDAVAMGMTVNSTTGGKHAKTSNHYRHNQSDGKGHAIDVGGTPAQMRAFYKKYARVNPKELYYDPMGGIKRGRNIGSIGGHGNHVHLALS